MKFCIMVRHNKIITSFFHENNNFICTWSKKATFQKYLQRSFLSPCNQLSSRCNTFQSTQSNSTATHWNDANVRTIVDFQTSEHNTFECVQVSDIEQSVHNTHKRHTAHIIKSWEKNEHDRNLIATFESRYKTDTKKTETKQRNSCTDLRLTSIDCWTVCKTKLLCSGVFCQLLKESFEMCSLQLLLSLTCSSKALRKITKC